LGEVTGVGIVDDALRLIAKRELGVPEECVVGAGDQPTGHLQDRVGGSGLDAGGQFLGLRFQFGGQWLRHDDLLPEEIPNDAQSYTEVNTVPTNFRDAYPMPSTRLAVSFRMRSSGWVQKSSGANNSQWFWPTRRNSCGCSRT
jgi:hypothetical protein